MHSYLRFYYATLSALTMTLLYPPIGILFINTERNFFIANLFFLGTANFLGIPVAYPLERHVRKDFLEGLTGVPNRRRFEGFLEHEWRRAKRTQRPISLLMIDMDFFRDYKEVFSVT